MKKLCWPVLGIFALLAHSSFAQTIRRVNPNSNCTSGCSGADFGTTNAFKYLQDAIDASSPGDEVWVMEGTHFPTKDTTGNTVPSDPRTKTFELKDGVDVYGGYSSSNVRNPAIYETILSGDIGNLNNTSDNCYCIIFGADLSIGSVIDGLTITKATGTGASLYRSFARFHNVSFIFNTGWDGAGVFASQGDYEFSSCYFYNNTADYGGAGYFAGNINIKECVFVENISNASSNQLGGGALFFRAGSAEIANSLFYKNEAAIRGGAIELWGYLYNSCKIINTTFFENESVDGGAIYFGVLNDVEVTNSIFQSNSASSSGGDINGSGSLTVTHSLTQTNISGTGNIWNGNPGFVDVNNLIGPDGLWATADDGLHLGPNSDAVNAGDNSACTTYSITEDITGGPRIENGTVDMGAYEGISDLCGVDTVLYVDWQATGSNTGGCWEHAFTTLEEALDELANNASNYPNVYKVKVAEGSYKPTTTTNENLSFALANGIHIYGGYTNTCVEPNCDNTRDPAVHTTELTGYLGVGLRSRNIIKGNNITQRTELDGFEIKLGRMDNPSGVGGAAMHLSNSDGLVVRNCTITDNASDYASGGGVYCNASSPTFEDCYFTANSTEVGYFGGAVMNVASSGPSFINCSFSENNSEKGGAVYSTNSSHAEFSGCNFYDNSADLGGAVCMMTNTNGSFYDCTFNRNVALLYEGGAVYIRGNCAPAFNECLFQDNVASIRGGAVFVYNESYPSMANCAFDRNISGYEGAGLYMKEKCSVELFGCVFSQNKSNNASGGALYVENSRLDLNNATVFGNKALIRGGGLYCSQNGEANIADSIFWKNTTSSGGVANADREVFLGGAGASASFIYSMTQYYPIGSAYNNTQGANPDFVSEADPDGPNNSFFDSQVGLRLKASSISAINGGNNAYAPSDIATDMADKVRVQKGLVDKGAYETHYGTMFIKYPDESDDLQLFMGCPELEIADTKNILEFGADETGQNNSTEAFLLASEWLRDNSDPNHRLELIIPEGTYLVGIQLANGQDFSAGNLYYENTSQNLVGLPIIHLEDVRNATIRGEGHVYIKYEDGLYYGGWDHSLTNPEYVSGENICSIDAFIKLRNCDCIHVENLEVNGNVDVITANGQNSGPLTGGNNGNGLSMEYDGLNVFGSRNISIQNTDFHHFGREGISITDGSGILTEDILMSGSLFEYNGRWAMHIGGGDLIRGVNTSYSYTTKGGFDNSNKGAGGGIDFESSTGRLTQLYFKECSMLENNKRSGVSADVQVPYWLYGDVEFDNCTFLGGGHYAVLHTEMMRRTRFLECSITGQVHYCSGSGPFDKIWYDGCTFKDVNPNGSPIFHANSAMLNFGSAAQLHPSSINNAYYHLSNCTFDSRSTRLYIGPDEVVGEAGDPAHFNTWECNTLNFFTDNLFTSGDLGGCESGSYQFGIIFLRNSKFYSNTIVDMNPVNSTVVSLSPKSCSPENNLGLQIFGANLFDGNNKTLPVNTENNTAYRLWRQNSTAGWNSAPISQF